MVVFKAKNVHKSFDGLNVLNDVSFELQEGTITSLFGENGSGKTTLFNIISGFMAADSGEMLYKSRNINKLSPVNISQLGIGRVWQTPRVCKNLSLLDNLLIASKSHPGENPFNYLIRLPGILKEEKRLKNDAKAILSDIKLLGKLQKTAGSLSLGEQKLLSVGMMLMNNADLLMLDEPFAGVQAYMVEHISEVLKNLKKQKKTIILIEHNRTIAGLISDTVLMLTKGKIEREAAYA